ncbi:IS110 family transposase, partial [Mycetohabitans sp. B8]|nr:IS110 family transposase [Mycetohabitans sp. B8]
MHTVRGAQAAMRVQALLEVIERYKQKWSLPQGVRVVVSYE